MLSFGVLLSDCNLDPKFYFQWNDYPQPSCEKLKNKIDRRTGVTFASAEVSGTKLKVD